jgi:hypothetical protein
MIELRCRQTYSVFAFGQMSDQVSFAAAIGASSRRLWGDETIRPRGVRLFRRRVAQ